MTFETRKKNAQNKQLKSNLPLMGLEPLLLFPRCLLKLLSKEKRKVKKKTPAALSKQIFAVYPVHSYKHLCKERLEM